jgi:hypothetical protein
VPRPTRARHPQPTAAVPTAVPISSTSIPK